MSNDSKTEAAGPKGKWLLGNAEEFKRDPLGYLIEWHKNHGDWVPFKIGPAPIVLVVEPDLIHEILVTKANQFTKDAGIKNNQEFFGNGLLRSEGDFWKRQRKLASPAFSPRRLEEYGAVMVDHTESRVNGWKDASTIDFSKEMMRLTLGIAVKTLFDSEISEESEDFEVALSDAQKYLAERLDDIVLLLLPEWIPFPSNVHLQEAIKKIDKVVYRLINERRGKTEGRHDLLSSLLSARDDDGSSMSDQQIRDEVFTLFFAGHETTALTLTYTFYLLSQNPEVEAKLLAEIKSVLGDKKAVPTDAHRLDYARKVIMEAMRVLPPVWAIAREAAEHTTIGGHDVPKGTSMLISQWVNNKDERWFKDHEKFDPDRWTHEFSEQLPKFAYFPFGGGPRTCIGNNFSLMEAVLVLTGIIREYHLDLVPGQKLEFRPAATLRPKHPINMQLHKR